MMSDSTRLKEEFKTSVEDYLELCEEQGLDPSKPYPGTITYRTTPERHKLISEHTMETSTSHSDVIDKAIDLYLSTKKEAQYGT